ncbi:carbohydrate ABC transporter permease [Spirochaeta isovalerica]|uniref:Raffinose/stachyose/melibiose transport system permease protein n=1 Tax=Spirochaeta isovalerica TaxID=150 RepID=A0A841RDS6_9SPIO|nr:carbohydrate ABC transporter permease [Spirochaeta isovalerica]MBB6482133.1 raffinose/stachyose/melibiose transport system permease protein [Spirochaeta isovalerica]
MKISSADKLYSHFTFVMLILISMITLFPIYMALINSLKPDGKILSDIMALPANPLFSNYATAFEKTRFARSFLNTLVVLTTGLAGIIYLSSMAGYKLSRSKGKLSSFFFFLFVMSMIIPFHSIMITLTKVARVTGVQGSAFGLGLIYTGLGVPMAVFLYHGFVKSIPMELDEAALMDGCGEFRYFFSIIMPLIMPITATVAILNTLWMWNDFLLPLLMLTDSDNYTILLSTNMLFGQYNNNDWSAILATLILAMMPVMIFYFTLQKYITRGIADGAIKG